MFSFIPHVLIILSIVGIIVIVARRTPGLREAWSNIISTPRSQGLNLAFFKRIFLNLAAGLSRGAVWLARKIWHYVLEVKEISKKGDALRQHIPKKFPSFSIPKTAKIPFFRKGDERIDSLREAEEFVADNKFAEAEQAYIKIIKKDEHNEAAFAGLGKLYLAQKNFSEAVETFQYLTKQHPDNDQYHSNFGQALHAAKSFDLAIGSYERAIEIAPKNSRRYINLGLSLEAKRHYGEAILNYRKAIELEPKNTKYMFLLFEALMKNKEEEEAGSVLEKILLLEPTNHRAREMLMKLKFKV